MFSPRPPPSTPVAGSSFATVTDPTLHRHGWRSPRATEPAASPSRKIPGRYRSLLRYDALTPPLFDHVVPERAQSSRDGLRSSSVSHASPPRAASAPADTPTTEEAAAVVAVDRTNLDELKWFQHRWLDKHGKNSHLKEYREKLALLRRWFESLDADGSGEVGLDELEDPLVSVGLARSRDEVQRLIDQVDKDGSGEVTFTEFLSMMNPEKPKRSKFRQPLHKPKVKASVDTGGLSASTTDSSTTNPSQAVPGAVQRKQSRRASSTTPTSKPAEPTATTNPVVKLFEDLQSGKLGDLAIPFPVLITAYRRRMLLNAHMAEDPTARRLGTSVLQALESTRREAASHAAHHETPGSHRRGSVAVSATNTSSSTSSPSSYLKNYISTAEAAAQENTRSASTVGKATHLPVLEGKR